jgi:mono/diheme cytochrome c family protein
MSLVQIVLLAAMIAGAAVVVIGRAPWLGTAVAACAGLALVVTVIVSSATSRHRVQAMHRETIELTPAEARGRELFAVNCSNCHTLRAVNAVGQVGPDLDFLRPPPAVVRRRIHEGSEGLQAVMPREIVTGSDAADVAAFVAKVAGR